MKNEITKKENMEVVKMREKFSEIQKWGIQNLDQKEIYAVSKMAVSYGLDPFLRHIEILGGNIYITLAGLRAHAENHGDLAGIVAKPIMGNERIEMLEMADMSEDTIVFYAEVYRKEITIPFTGYGFANSNNVNLKGKKRKDIFSMAENRSVARALRKAFSVGMTAIEEIHELPVDVEFKKTENEEIPAGKKKLDKRRELMSALKIILGVDKKEAHEFYRDKLKSSDALEEYVTRNTPPNDDNERGF